MAIEPSSRRFYRFGEFRLDALSGELYHAAEPLRLPPLPSKLLLHLVAARGQLLTSGHPQKALWRYDSFVDFQQSIRKAITQIRGALEDSAEKPAYIETVSRRGYRFVADVQLDGAEPPKQEREKSPYPGLAPFAESDSAFFFG